MKVVPVEQTRIHSYFKTAGIIEDIKNRRWKE